MSERHLIVFALFDNGKAIDQECMIITEIWGYGEGQLDDMRQDIWEYIEEQEVPKEAVCAEFKITNEHHEPEQRSFPEHIDFRAYWEMDIALVSWSDADGNKNPVDQ